MKLLLTSNGLVNPSIIKSLEDLAGKPLTECSLVFIPTAADIKDQDKSWYIQDLQNIKQVGFKFIDLVDIAALPKENFLPRLQKADVLFFSGGHTHFLLYWIEKSGLKSELEKLLETKVYVGVSAGSIAAGIKAVTAGSSGDFGYDKYEGKALGFAPFCIRPHFGRPYYKEWTEQRLQDLANEQKIQIYGLDDQSAVKVADGKIEVVTEGQYKIFNPDV